MTEYCSRDFESRGDASRSLMLLSSSLSLADWDYIEFVGLSELKEVHLSPFGEAGAKSENYH